MGIFYGPVSPHSAILEPGFRTRKVEKSRWTVIKATQGPTPRQAAPGLGSALEGQKQAGFYITHKSMK
jgi:hypothetical protein